MVVDEMKVSTKLIKRITKKFYRMLHKRNEQIVAVSDGSIIHAFESDVLLPKSIMDKGRENNSVLSVFADALLMEKQGDYVQFVLSRDYIKNILKSDAEYISFSVNKNIDTQDKDKDGTSGTKNAVIIRYSNIKLISLLMTCTRYKMQFWTLDIDSVS